MGCSIGYKDVIGLDFYPVLIWDTRNYEVKQLGEGAEYVQLSRDNKYVMLERRHVKNFLVYVLCSNLCFGNWIVQKHCINICKKVAGILKNQSN